MDYHSELEQEREYTARVQQMLCAVIQVSRGNAEFQDDTIRMMLTDAWEELRMKPTALSQQDLDQLNAEIDRFIARRTFAENRAAQYEKMLKNPFFARIDFREDGEEAAEKIVIGLYCLKDIDGHIMVHDWRAPVCSMYYDSMPGQCSFESPSGSIAGVLTLKRQYVMENGRLKYFVNTEYSIDDSILLDILSGAASGYMRQIVATIQSEQNAAIRHERARVLSVTGGAGSGKTSVAMHRAAYLMYRYRDYLNAQCIAVLSPTNAFSEYISCVLPELGEENTQSMTLYDIIRSILNRPIESPVEQNEVLLASDNPLRRESVAWKSSTDYLSALERAIGRFSDKGPAFKEIALGKHVLASKSELERMYKQEYKLLNPFQRLTRMKAILDNRLENWEKSLYKQYETQLVSSYRNKDLEFATRMAVAQRLHPVRSMLKSQFSPEPLRLYADALKVASEDLCAAAQKNALDGVVWWEDAPGVALMMIKLGFVRPNTSIRHLLVDEAQDYPDVSFRLLASWFPKADVTLLGDPNQRTVVGLPACNPSLWGNMFGEEDAPLVCLTKGYRSTLEIAEFCNALLPDGSVTPQAFGRHGKVPLQLAYTPTALEDQVEAWRAASYKRIAVITRTQQEAVLLSRRLKKAILLTGDANELEEAGVILSGLHLMKGMEFDAVAVVWPDIEVLSDDERRRLYTACSRALHELTVFRKK